MPSPNSKKTVKSTGARKQSNSGTNGFEHVTGNEVIYAKSQVLQDKYRDFMTAVNSNMLKNEFSDGVPKPGYMIGLSEDQVGIYIKNLIIYKIIEDIYKTVDEPTKSELNILFFIIRHNNFDIRHWLIFKEETPHGKLKKAANSLTSLLPVVGNRDHYKLEINSDILDVLKGRVRVKGFIEKILHGNKAERNAAKADFQAFINTLGIKTREGAALVEQAAREHAVASLPSTVNPLDFQLEQLLKDMPRGGTDLDRRLRLLLEFRAGIGKRKGGSRRSKRTGGSRRSKRTRKNRKIRL